MNQEKEERQNDEIHTNKVEQTFLQFTGRDKICLLKGNNVLDSKSGVSHRGSTGNTLRADWKIFKHRGSALILKPVGRNGIAVHDATKSRHGLRSLSHRETGTEERNLQVTLGGAHAQQCKPRCTVMVRLPGLRARGEARGSVAAVRRPTRVQNRSRSQHRCSAAAPPASTADPLQRRRRWQQQLQACLSTGHGVQGPVHCRLS